MTLDARNTSWWDTARLQVLVAVPAFFLGLVAANRFFLGLFSRYDAGRSTARFLDGLRQKYQSDRLWSWFPWGRTLVVLDQRGIDAVLASEENAADPPIKKDALSKFIPDALTISSGAEWSDRRRFNEDALGFGGLSHGHRDAFKDIAFRAADQLITESGELCWADFQALGQSLSHQVLLGSGQVQPDMAAQMARMASRANWPGPRQQRCFSAFYGQIDQQLAAHRAGGDSVSSACLMHDSAKLLDKKGAAGEGTRVPTQIGFWFVVLKDVVELHVARTLALVAAHSQVQDRVREEVRQAGTLTADAIDGLHYLQACLAEQLRLWTPVPILLRRAVKSFSLIDGITLEAQQQILMHAGFYHRDPRVFGATANEFSPDRLTKASPPVYFFSGGRQSCAGQVLARFVLKATLARLLGKFRFELIGPSVGPGHIPYLYDHFKVRLRLLDAAGLQGAERSP